jgi:hypothetical protein
MTRNQIIASVVLGIFASLLTPYVWPTIRAAAQKYLAWVLISSHKRERALYIRVAIRDTSPIFPVTMAGSMLLIIQALRSPSPISYSGTIALVLIAYSVSWLSYKVAELVEVQRLLRTYDFHRTRLRPRVDESFLILLDARLTEVRSKADYDAVRAALLKAPETNPRCSLDERV